MSRYVLSPLAQVDINDIWEYTVKHWNIDQAEHYILDIEIAVKTLADDPHQGRPCEKVRDGYYRYNIGSHVVFYRLIDIGIDVVRILHSRRDFRRHL